MPAHARQHPLRIAAGQLGHEDGGLRHASEHVINNDFPLLCGDFRQAVGQIDLCAKARLVRNAANRAAQRAQHGIAQPRRDPGGGGDGAYPQPDAPITWGVECVFKCRDELYLSVLLIFHACLSQCLSSRSYRG
ncbi:hypothetical protein SODG_004576 [Sodalis praecaptivus]